MEWDIPAYTASERAALNERPKSPKVKIRVKDLTLVVCAGCCASHKNTHHYENDSVNWCDDCFATTEQIEELKKTMPFCASPEKVKVVVKPVVVPQVVPEVKKVKPVVKKPDGDIPAKVKPVVKKAPVKIKVKIKTPTHSSDSE